VYAGKRKYLARLVRYFQINISKTNQPERLGERARFVLGKARVVKISERVSRLARIAGAIAITRERVEKGPSRQGITINPHKRGGARCHIREPFGNGVSRPREQRFSRSTRFFSSSAFSTITRSYRFPFPRLSLDCCDFARKSCWNKRVGKRRRLSSLVKLNYSMISPPIIFLVQRKLRSVAKGF